MSRSGSSKFKNEGVPRQRRLSFCAQAHQDALCPKPDGRHNTSRHLQHLAPNRTITLNMSNEISHNLQRSKLHEQGRDYSRFVNYECDEEEGARS